MPDRPYDEAIRALRTGPVPDQWDEIAARADEGVPIVPSHMSSNGSDGRGGPGRLWPLLVAAAASVVVITAVVVLFTRDDPDVTTDVPATPSQPAPSSTTPTLPPSTPSTAPSAERPTLEELGNYPASACKGIVLATSTPPQGVSGTQAMLENPDDPRVPEFVRHDVVGVFTSDTTTRAMFVVAGWPGLNDESGTIISGPFPGRETWVSEYGDGWVAEIRVPLGTETDCPATLLGVGFTEADLRAFLNGLTLEG